MIKMEEIVNKVDMLLADKGLTQNCDEPTVRQLLLHLYTAIDIYRYMTQAEKNAAGSWFRAFDNSFTLRNFLKERKRKREKEKSPLHPSYKEKSGVKEKAQNPHTIKRGRAVSMDERKMAFLLECEKYYERYGKKMVDAFYCHWSEENKADNMLRFEYETTWNTGKRLYKWKHNPISAAEEAANLRLAKAQGKQVPVDTAEQKRQAAEREDANERLFRQIEENKKGAVSREEWLRMKSTQKEPSPLCTSEKSMKHEKG